MKSIFSSLVVILLCFTTILSYAQAIRIPQSTNLKNSISRDLSSTTIAVKWSAPGVKGREGKIWGTDIAYFGNQVLGFGSNVESPWRAGADECTTISFSTDVKINGKDLSAGNYAFFIELDADSSTLIFNKNTTAWGSYFYRKDMDVLRVKTKQIKDLPEMVERLDYKFLDQKDNSVTLALEWEHWRIPMNIEIDKIKTTLATIRKQMDSELGFDPPSLIAAAQWCDQNNVNTDEAMNWINSATLPSLGGIETFNALSVKSNLLAKKGKTDEAKLVKDKALNVATSIELHQYGRTKLFEKKIDEALQIFQLNFDRFKGAWPTPVGLMRGYSAKGDLKKALEYAKIALPQASDEINKRTIENAIKTLEGGKPL